MSKHAPDNFFLPIQKSLGHLAKKYGADAVYRRIWDIGGVQIISGLNPSIAIPVDGAPAYFSCNVYLEVGISRTNRMFGRPAVFKWYKKFDPSEGETFEVQPEDLLPEERKQYQSLAVARLERLKEILAGV